MSETITRTCYLCGVVEQLPKPKPGTGYAACCYPCFQAKQKEADDFERFDSKARANGYYGRGR